MALTIGTRLGGYEKWLMGGGLACATPRRHRSGAGAAAYVREGDIDAETAVVALDDFRALDLQRHAHEPLLERIWELRQNLTAYDAVYVALAEVLDSVLVTCDGPLSRAPAMAGRVELLQAKRMRP